MSIPIQILNQQLGPKPTSVICSKEALFNSWIVILIIAVLAIVAMNYSTSSDSGKIVLYPHSSPSRPAFSTVLSILS
jgi:hypothetical protein